MAVHGDPLDRGHTKEAKLFDFNPQLVGLIRSEFCRQGSWRSRVQAPNSVDVRPVGGFIPSKRLRHTLLSARSPRMETTAGFPGPVGRCSVFGLCSTEFDLGSAIEFGWVVAFSSALFTGAVCSLFASFCARLDSVTAAPKRSVAPQKACVAASRLRICRSFTALVSRSRPW